MCCVIANSAIASGWRQSENDVHVGAGRLKQFFAGNFLMINPQLIQ
jgi:hypothetical protein